MMKKMRVVVLTLFFAGLCFSLSTVVKAGTVGVWFFDEGSGQTANDSSGNANHGQLGTTAGVDANDPSWAAGKFGSALYFDGNDRVHVPYDASLDENINNWPGFTLESWVKADTYVSGPIQRRMISRQNNWELTLVVGASPADPQSSVFNSITGTTEWIIPGPSVPYNTWTHVAFTYDESTMRVYANGALVASKPYSYNLASNPVNPSLDLLIGDRSWSASRGLWGYLDEVRISNVALTPAELGYHGTLVPEPGTLLLLGTGLLGMIGLIRRRR